MGAPGRMGRGLPREVSSELAVRGKSWQRHKWKEERFLGCVPGRKAVNKFPGQVDLGNDRLCRSLPAGLVRALTIVIMNIVYLHQTYLLTLEGISWNNSLDYPLGHPRSVVLSFFREL